MICPNCGAEIISGNKCNICNINVNLLKIEDENKINSLIFLLVLENGVKFDIEKLNLEKITIGRKDIVSNPVIDLGPYDTGPFISRKHGFFLIENHCLFYVDTSKNGTIINNKKIEKNTKIKLKDGDKIKFGKIKAEVILH
ncbi:MAG: hypothetical protein A2086_02340 [Spirochaetes bacterium GWD1_27_9]|nr:MAG: hypothetical protein A2Z98_03330 [Spirochaetes bacterium GWB1_27_13]OHD24692.1 MAG: hypothetical protein A2Y34_10775 [Spirochaetes bacterium GWC1_27_15]OHD30415.1 MAG: hypothetical protein A2086_02340 [Spirochaetes bacterium GWD1_27_9]